MSEEVIVIGGGGHARVVIDCVQASGDAVVGILDDALAVGSTVLDVPVLGNITDYKKYPDKKFMIAIGSNAVRRRLAERMTAEWYTAVHPRAVVSQYAVLGAGCVVMPNAVINAGAVVGAHCIINTGAIVEHDSRLADYVHISPAAALAGTVSVGAETHIGIGAVVRNNIQICGGCTVGAGAVVVKNITESGIYVGVPAHME